MIFAGVAFVVVVLAVIVGRRFKNGAAVADSAPVVAFAPSTRSRLRSARKGETL